MKIFFFILGFILCFRNQADAALGEKLTSSANQKLISNVYHVQTSTESGLEIRQYIDQNNNVFAVSWSGRRHPNLSVILGAHFSDYQVEIAKRHAGHQPLMLKTSRMKLHLSGHMRSVRGYAYEDRLLPSDFNLELLK